MKETSILSVGLHPQSNHHHKTYLNVYPNMFALKEQTYLVVQCPHTQQLDTSNGSNPVFQAILEKTGNFPGFPRVQTRPRKQVCPSLAVEYGLTWFYNPLLRSAGTTYFANFQ
jgi:hypothetical protein